MVDSAMTNDIRVLTIALLAPPEATASALFGMYDLFISAGRDWDMLIEGKPGHIHIQPLVVSADGKGFRSCNGIWIEPDASVADAPAPDVICIPDIFVSPDEDISGRYDAEIAWIRERFEGGATLATACTGALLLAEAGLLNGLDVTTHWAYCEAMAARYPEITVHPNRALIVTGPEQRIVMAGGGTSWLDLGLFMIARHLGVEEAMHTARLHLIDWHDIGQQPFAVLTSGCKADDAVIARCQEWAADNYVASTPVAAMETLSGLTERSFKRRFKQATGMSPMEYVHTIRLEETKQLLETTDLPVEAIANEVGYEDASFFGRLFKRKVGLTPVQYRKRFKTLRTALESGYARVGAEPQRDSGPP
jgi:transcriptional regulator GlxA family with amidase domain